MDAIKVSIIVPVYNVEHYLPTCLDSLVSQTLKEIEIIVVNDGSPDNSQLIINDYEKRYPAIIRSFVKENGGLSDARNYGVCKASGKYLAFVDSDDYVNPCLYEEMYNKAVQTEAQIICCGITHVYKDRISCTYYPQELFNKSVYDSPRVLEYVNSYAWNKLFLRSFWVLNSFTFPKNQWFEDSALIYNTMLVANKIACVNSPLYYYRHERDDSITNQLDARVFDVLKSCSSIVLFYEKHDALGAPLFEEVEFVCLRHATARYRNLIYSSNLKMAHDYVHCMVSFFDLHFPNWQKSRYINTSKGDKLSTRLYKLILRHKMLMLLLIYCPKSLIRSARKCLSLFSKKRNTAF